MPQRSREPRRGWHFLPSASGGVGREVQGSACPHHFSGKDCWLFATSQKPHSVPSHLSGGPVLGGLRLEDGKGQGGAWMSLDRVKKAERELQRVCSHSIAQIRNPVLGPRGQLVQFSCSVVSDSLQHHGLQHARPPCPSPTPEVYSNSCPSCQSCHTTISSSVIPFSSHLQSFPGSGSFPMSQFFASGGQSIGISASASALPMNIQD